MSVKQYGGTYPISVNLGIDHVTDPYLYPDMHQKMIPIISIIFAKRTEALPNLMKITRKQIQKIVFSIENLKSI